MTSSAVFAIIFMLAGFLLGSIPFSVLVGKWLGKTDIRQFGDKNPGATNALRSAGWKAGLLALLLDVSKGALPIGLAYQVFQVNGAEMVLVAIAPILGHAYSPFLGWRGGKALAVSLGVWIGLLLYVGPLIILPMLIFWYWLLDNDGWSVLLTTLGLGGYLLVTQPTIVLLGAWFGQVVLVAWKHRNDLKRMPKIRKQVLKIFWAGK